ncbi:Avirulence (Avh) protein [Phytophthora megakarya]|uniref:RxLR effector protein n=1 Tax=Phytophthora megakarya TaxID=4795 RepID=A0A225W976_9STRA|nr:Avirulence (Avh) protein [Phytophthora megakarya]
MLLSRVLVIVAASFLLASETTVTADSNQAKISTVGHDGSSHRLLRGYKPVEDDSDDLDDLDETEERGGNSGLKDLAKSWGLSFSDITSGVVKLNESQYNAWKAMLNKGIDAGKKANRDAYNAAWRKANGYGRRV